MSVARLLSSEFTEIFCFPRKNNVYRLLLGTNTEITQKINIYKINLHV